MKFSLHGFIDRKFPSSSSADSAPSTPSANGAQKPPGSITPDQGPLSKLSPLRSSPARNGVRNTSSGSLTSGDQRGKANASSQSQRGVGLPDLQVGPRAGKPANNKISPAAQMVCAVEQWRLDQSQQPSERREDAARRIAACGANEATDLDLSNLGLTTLPDLRALTHLEFLNLSGNQFESKFDSLPNCIALLSMPDQADPGDSTHGAQIQGSSRNADHAATIIQRVWRGARQRNINAKREQLNTPHHSELAYRMATHAYSINDVPRRVRFGKAESEWALYADPFHIPEDGAALLHSFRDHEGLTTAKRRIHGNEVPRGVVYSPIKDDMRANNHDMRTNNAWMLGLAHHEKRALLTTTLNDTTVARRSKPRGDPQPLSALAREVLGLAQAHFVVERMGNDVYLVPKPSARTAKLTDLKTPSSMPKSELKRRLQEIGLDSDAITVPQPMPARGQPSLDERLNKMHLPLEKVLGAAVLIHSQKAESQELFLDGHKIKVLYDEKYKMVRAQFRDRYGPVNVELSDDGRSVYRISGFPPVSEKELSYLVKSGFLHPSLLRHIDATASDTF
ncbi:leucine-rich repeat domain-containing protein [Paraburkholderia sp. CI3]|uniref:leucine-rich repeat domain-containing protein n=1 Tax=Paraburkholderia sp. CI3 TaxID=2991060 RepID=UPI003D1D128F